MSTPTNPTGVEAAVCEDIARRQQLGIQKYGGTVADNPAGLREWLQHAYEECLDQAVYLKRAMVEITEFMAERDRYKAALVQILKDGNRPMSMRVSSPSIIASDALQSPENA
jgi:hypothetical protein